ncbi:hypothetical protein ACN6IQ_04125 [Fannyhessea vaginae]|uniref:hypothetical protein n=1 Tax=Fannyhessea vaginae TaxID=82135 RepID=UPI003B215537
MNKLTQWVKSHKPHTAGLAVAIIAVISLSVAGATGVFSAKPADTASDKPAAAAKVPTKAEKAPLKIDVSADDKVTESSTPTIVHVQSTDKREEPIDFYHAVDSGKKTDTVQVTPGDYKVNVTGVINNDGSVAKPVAESKEIAVNVKADDKVAENKATVDVKLDKTIPADQVTAEDVEEIANTTKVAIENGDSSLKGDSGKAILEKVENNTNANTHLSEDAKATVTESTSEAQASTSTEAKPTAPETPAPASQSSAPASNSNESASAPAEKTQTWVPEKGHWENITERVWVPNVVTVTDKPAWDEKVSDGTLFVCSDGFTTHSITELRAYDKKMMLAGTPISYSIQKQYKTVHHDAVTHTEDRGYYEDKVTGKHWVVDEAGHYE